MSLGSLYQKIVLFSPKLEVAFRSFYWNNVKMLIRFRKASSVSSVPAVNEESKTSDFNKITAFIKNLGVKDDDILLVHSSFDGLKSSQLDAEGIINKLLEIVPTGTLAMPAIRHFKEESEGEEYILNYIDADYKDVVTTYDIYRTPISSGLLPFSLMRYDDAEVSEFPLNPMVAVGKDAEAMMRHNIEGELPSAHGKGSSWNYCLEHDAWNIGLGVDMKDFLTIFHVTQEGGDWHVKNWFFLRKFIIKKGKREKELTINERAHKWTKYLAEINFYNDMYKAGVLKYAIIEGIQISAVRSSDMVRFIKSHKCTTYPYFINRKDLK